MPKVYISDYFLKQLKPYAKKYRQLPEDIVLVLEKFLPQQAQALGLRLFKFRLKASDLPKGKNKSFRLIIYFWQDSEMVTPITIYFKGDVQNLPKEEIKYHTKLVIAELEEKNII